MAPPTPRMNRVNRTARRPNSPFNNSRNKPTKFNNIKFHYMFEVLVSLFPYAPTPFEKRKMLKDFVNHTKQHYNKFSSSQLSYLYTVYPNLVRQYENHLNRVLPRQVQR